MYYVGIKYSMCDLICDVITCCVWSCNTGKINASDKIMFENQKKKINMEIKDIFYINLDLTDRSDVEFTVCRGELMPHEALTSFTVSDAYRHFDSQA